MAEVGAAVESPAPSCRFAGKMDGGFLESNDRLTILVFSYRTLQKHSAIPFITSIMG
jgi:hypothetical protein